MSGGRRKLHATADRAAEDQMRDQEVLRANRELAAYFKGRRTEREARAALKIIKAFIRDRERRDVSSRPPLPGADATKTPKELAKRKIVSAAGEWSRRERPHKPQEKSSGRVPASVEAELNPELEQPLTSDQPTDE
jgi:hypothetical protein